MKTKALINCAVTAQLICVFVFAYAKGRFSRGAAHIDPLVLKGRFGKVAAHLRSFFEKGGLFARLFIVYICAKTFSQVNITIAVIEFFDSQAIIF